MKMGKICPGSRKVHLTEARRVYRAKSVNFKSQHDHISNVCDEVNYSKSVFISGICTGNSAAHAYNLRASSSLIQSHSVQEPCSQNTVVLESSSEREIRMKCTASQTQQQDQNVCCATYPTHSKTNTTKFVNASHGKVKVQAKPSSRKNIELRQHSIRSSQEKVRRPEHHVVGFMEDHAEFLSDCFEAEDETGRYTTSVLESTVDGSIVRGARRSYGSRVSSDDLDFFIDTAIKKGSNDQDPLISLDEWGLKTEVHKYKCSLCNFTNRMRSSVESHIVEAGDAHRGAVVVVLLGDYARGKICPICSIKFRGRQLFKHIRYCHGSSFPLRCGYCVFLGQDYNQLRQHIRKKHNTSVYKIIDIPRILAKVDQDEKTKPSEDTEVGCDRKEVENVTSWHQDFECPVCHIVLKTLSNLKRHLVKHGRKRKQCVLCPFTTTLPTQIRSHYRRKHPRQTPKWRTTLLEEGLSGSVKDITPFMKLITAKYGVRQPNKDIRWIRQYRCPHCDYTCSFNSSYNRHLFLHQGIKPFKCGYCDFHAREAYVIRKHSRKEHKGRKPVVEGGKTLKAPYRYALKKDKEKQNQDNLCETPDLKDSKKDNDIDLPLSAKAPHQEREPYKMLSKKVTSQKTKLNSHQNIRNIDNDEYTDGQNKPGTLVKENPVEEIKVAEIRTDCQHESSTSFSNTVPEESPLDIYLYLKDSVSQTKMNNYITKDTKEACAAEEIHRVNQIEPVKACNFSSVVNSYTNKSYENIQNPPDSQSRLIQQTVLANEYLYSQGKLIDKLGKLKERDLYVHKLGKLKERDLYVDKFGKLKKRDIYDDEYKWIKKTQQSETSSNDSDVFCQIFLSDSVFDSPKNDVFIQLDTCNSENSLSPTIMCIQDCATEENFKFKKDLLDNVLDSSNSANHTMLHLKNSKETIEERTSSTSCTSVNNIKSANSCFVAGDDSYGRSQHETYKPETEGNCKNVKKTSSKSNVRIKQIKKVHVVSSQAEDESKDEKSNGETVGKGETGLENNLHTHISFLADSRLNNTTASDPEAAAKSLLHPSYTNNDYFSSEKIRSMMIKKTNGQVTCSECGVTTAYRAFYKHARKHFNIKPYKCGYCYYRSIEKSKIRVHHTFCHSESPCIILLLSPEEAAVPTPNTANKLNIKSVKSKDVMSVNNENLVTTKHGKNMKNNLPHESNNDSLTGTITNSELMQEVSRVPKSRRMKGSSTIQKPYVSTAYCLSEPDEKIRSFPSRLSMYQCPLCLKFMQKHTPSIRRHLYRHYGYKPYKCGYCSFTGSAQTEVRAHHVTHGCTIPPRVEPSGNLMPGKLAVLINEMTCHHHSGRQSQKRKAQATQQSPGLSFKHSLTREVDPNGKGGSANTHTQTVMYLTQEKNSEQILVSAMDHIPPESPVTGQRSLSQPMENEDLASETAYAVQTLESDGITSGCLPSQLGFSMDTDPPAYISQNPVCVVCFIE